MLYLETCIIPAFRIIGDSMLEAGAKVHMDFIYVCFMLNHYFLYMRVQNVASICLKACQRSENFLSHQKILNELL